MIPAAYITEWSHSAPWQNPDMVEQDLIICRALIELFGDKTVSRHFAFRGGTALYKLFMMPAPRYSEDIDLVQIDAEPIGETIDSIHNILDPWLGKPRYDARASSYRLGYRFVSDSGIPLRLKVEINTREHIGSIEKRPFSVISRWFSGESEVTTFPLPELLGTKMRALYQRRKGRDLFDLDYALRHSDVDPGQMVRMFVKYIGASGLRISTAEFMDNLEQKRHDRQFRQDILPLLRPGIEYNVDDAAEGVSDLLLSRIDSEWEKS